MKRLLTVAAFCLAGSANAQELLGKFNVNGTDFNGGSYSGTAEIYAISDTTCEIHWNTGSQTSLGICMMQGNAFAASYVLGDKVGMAIYELKDNGTLDGTWTIQGSDGVGTEVLTPM